MTSSSDLCFKRSTFAQVITRLLQSWILLSLLMVATSNATGKEEVVAVSDFQQKDLSRWQKEEFDGQTIYSFANESERGWVLKAHSKSAASCLIREVQIDLRRTPYLNWSWKVEKLPGVDNDKTKASDDYPARIYVIFKTGRWFWDTRALNFVWSTTIPVGESWPNAFASQARMVAVRSGDSDVGRWVTEKRNIRKDIASYFDLEIESIEAVALMTDTDNSGSEAVAYYDSVYFSAR